MLKVIVSPFSDRMEYVVDSRLIAQELGIEHDTFIKTIRTYQSEIELETGQIFFDDEKSGIEREGGKYTLKKKPKKFAYLNEDHAIFFMTLSANTPQVVKCKKNLVLAFKKARENSIVKVKKPQHTSIYIVRLENSRDHKIGYEYWGVFQEAGWVYLMVEKEWKVPVEKYDLLDGSIGKHWKNFRKDKVWAKKIGVYIHKFRDQRGERESNAYDHSELSHFKEWLAEIYVPEILPKYFVDKIGKKATRLIYEENNLLNNLIFEITEMKKETEKQKELFDKFLKSRQQLSLISN